MQKHAGRWSIDGKMASRLSDPQYLLTCDVLSCERVVKTVQTSLRRNKDLRPVRDVSSSMRLYGILSLFRTSFPVATRCYVLWRHHLQAVYPPPQCSSHPYHAIVCTEPIATTKLALQTFCPSILFFSSSLLLHCAQMICFCTTPPVCQKTTWHM